MEPEKTGADSLVNEPQAKHSTEQSSEQNSLILDSITDIFMVLKPDWRLVYFNKPAQKHSNKSAAEVLGKTIWEVFPEIKGSPLEAFYHRAMAGNETLVFRSSSILNQDLQFEMHAYRTNSGLAILGRDVSELKKMEQKVSHLASFPELNPNPIVEVDLSGKITYQNPSAARLFPDLAQKALNHPWLLGVGSVPTKKPDGTPFFRELQLDGKWYGQSIHSVTPGNFVRIYGYDITQRKHAEDALRESEEKYRDLVEYSPTAIYEIDFNERSLKTVNDGMCKMLGYTEAELLAMDPMDLLDEPSRKTFLHRISQAQTGGNPADQIEYRAQRKDEKYLWGILNTKFKYVGGKIVGAFVVAHDITQRKEAEDALLESEQRLKFHLENSPLAIVEWDSNFVVTQWSKEAEKIFGWKKAEIVGRKLEELNMVYPADIPVVNRTMSRLTSGKEFTVVSSNRNLTKSGDVVESVWYNSVLIDKNGKMSSVMSLVQDITAQKKAETALRDSQALLNSMIENVPLVMLLVDKDRKVRKVNVAAEKFSNRAHDEMVGLAAGVALRCMNSFEDPRGCGYGASCELCPIRQTIEYSFEKSQGTKEIEVHIPVEGKGQLTLMLSTSMVGVGGEDLNLVCIRDITLTHKAEAELKRERDFSSTILQTVGALIVVMDPSGRIVLFNRACELTTGYSEDEVRGKFFYDLFITAEEMEGVKAVFEMLTVNSIPMTHKNYWVSRDGSRRLVQWSNSVVLDTSGDIRYVIGTGLDITDQAFAQEALSDSERRFRLVIHDSPITVFSQDMDLRYTWIYNAKPGVNPEQMIGKTDLEIYAASDGWKLTKLKTKVIQEGSGCKEMIRLGSGAEIYYYNILVEPIRNNDNEITGVIGVLMDITDLKQAELSLQSSEHRYRGLFQSILDGVFKTDLYGRIVDCNQAFLDITRYSADELKKLDLQQLTPERFHALQEDIISNQVLSRGYSDELENEIIRKDGTIFPARFRLWLAVGGESEPSGIWGIVRDISQLNLQEDELKKSEERYRLAQKAANIGSWDWQFSTGQLSLSEQMERIFAKQPGTFEGTMDDLLSFVHPDDRQAVSEGLKKAIETGVLYEKEYRIVLPDGSVRWLSSLGDLIRTGAAKPMRMVGTVRDITDQKLLSDQLKKSLKEKEILLQEINHRVKNNLQIITSLLRLQSANADESSRKVLTDSQNRIRSISLVHEILHHTKDFTQINLKTYLQTLIDEVRQSFAQTNKISIELDAQDVPIDIKSAIPCGLIVNELVINSFKHAFPLKNGRINISLRRDKSNVILVVSDNGVGISKDINWSNLSSLGLQLVHTLVEQLDGSLRLLDAPGTSFKLEFPEKK